MVSVEIAPSATADLVALGWLPTSDCVDKDALTRALVGLVDRVIAMRVTPSTRSEGTCFTPMGATAGPPIAIGSGEIALQSPGLGTLAERGSPRKLNLGRVEPGEILGAPEIVEDKSPEPEPCDGVDVPPPTSAFADLATEQAELSRIEPSEAQPWAEPPQPFEVDPARLWGPMYQSRKMWLPEWGPRPDQDGCLAPDYLL